MVDCRLKRNRKLSSCRKGSSGLTTKEKKEFRKMMKENMRLGASKDYAKGYQQAMSDCRVKLRRVGCNVRI